MDKIVEYRKKHPRCRYCKYRKHIPIPGYLTLSSYYLKCSLKDKYLNDDSLFWDLKGCFCKWFEPEERNK